MPDSDFGAEVAALERAFPGSELLPIPDRRLIRIPKLPLSGDWTPESIRGLLVCDLWPAARPQLLVGDELRRNGGEPANFSRQMVADEAWFAYSFNAPYSAEHAALVPVLRGWLRRFDGRSD